MTDTLDFDFSFPGAKNWFKLNREYKLNDLGFRQPVVAEGPYEYRIDWDSIQIQWSLSFCLYCPYKYYFRYDGDQVRVGNFIEKTGDILVFKKLK